ncbi:MAG TPA: metallophosphoesterase family protein [Polyangiaceae bacterium]|nr:metallophosphoesterase family protein [Polyangiaceae bacterium]
MRFLCISDIHGHADALAAVLATAERRGFSKLLVAGDLCFPGPSPLETWRKLTAANALCVQGVGDRALATVDLDNLRATSEHERARLDRLRSTRTELGDLILARLAKLPKTSRITIETGGEILLVHGSPLDPSEPFSHELSDEEMNALIGDDPADLIICGASHVPFDRQVGETRIVNVGSVGEAPGGQHAHATFVETSATGVVVEQFVVPLGRAA